jgi:hypothetical protein
MWCMWMYLSMSYSEYMHSILTDWLIPTYIMVYPKVSGLGTWSKNCKWYNSLPLGAVSCITILWVTHHNPLCFFSMSVCCCLFLYQLSQLGYILAYQAVHVEMCKWKILTRAYLLWDPRICNNFRTVTRQLRKVRYRVMQLSVSVPYLHLGLQTF